MKKFHLENHLEVHLKMHRNVRAVAENLRMMQIKKVFDIQICAQIVIVTISLVQRHNQRQINMEDDLLRGGEIRSFYNNCACPSIAASILWGSMPIYRCVIALELCCSNLWTRVIS